MNKLDEIQQRSETATAGPWKLWGMTVMADPLGNSNVDEAQVIAHTSDPDRGLRTFNASFIAHAREDLPKLVAALRAVEVVHRVAEYKTLIGPYCAGCTSPIDGGPELWPCPTIIAIREALV